MSSDSFGALGLHSSFCDTLAKLGFDQPTPIQSKSIPQAMSGKDILGLAQTGTGKTAAFGLPLLQQIQEIKKGRAEPKSPRSLILAPTRELALQIHAELEKFAANTNLHMACVIGGVGQSAQVKKLYAGIDVLVAAPGRLLDLMNQGHVVLNKTNFLVLDECDRLLDMGFIPDVRRILSTMPSKRQSMLFSATMPKEITRFAKETLKDPVKINVTPKEISVAKIQQRIYSVSKGEKLIALQQLLRRSSLRRAIVFTRTKHGANRIARQLNQSDFVAEVIHGNKSQAARQRAIQNFKKGKAWILVATDIAARGIDIQDVSHVINFDLPQEPESYVHRIGRTGRAGAEGVAWSLTDETEKSKVKAIERLIRREIEVSKLKVEKRDPRSGTDKSSNVKEVERAENGGTQGRKHGTQVKEGPGSGRANGKKTKLKGRRSKPGRAPQEDKAERPVASKRRSGKDRMDSKTITTQRDEGRPGNQKGLRGRSSSEDSSGKPSRRPRKRAVTP